MILRELREIDQTTDDILVYGFDGSINQKIKTDTDGRIDIISDNLDITLSTRASEATLTSVLTELQSIEAKDFATEATLALIKTAIDAINLTLDVSLSTRASEATLTLIKTAIDSIDTDLDIALSTRASETTLLDVKTNLDDIKVQLDTLNFTDFATESTSTEILETIGQESGATVLSRLLDIWNKLVELFNVGVAKVKIWDGDLVTDVIDDAGVNRLAVDVNQEGGVALQRFTVVVDYDAVGVALNTSTDTVLKTVNGNGRLDFISIDSGSSNYEVILEIDGVEVLRITMTDLGSNLGLANATNVPIWVETANKNFRLHPNTEGMDFTTSFTLKAKATSGTPSATWLVKYRNLV